MPDFMMKIVPSTTPAVTQNPPQRCNLTLVGSLNSIGVRTDGPNSAVVTGYMRLKEFVPAEFYTKSEVYVTAIGQDIEVDFYWPPYNQARRPLRDMFIDFYDPDVPSPVRSTLRLNAYLAGPETKDSLVRRHGATLYEFLEIPLYNQSQYLMIDNPAELDFVGKGKTRDPYVDDLAHGGHFIRDLVGTWGV